jgi:hypothetical protein
MSYILIAVYVMVIPGYSTLGEQLVPVRLGVFHTAEACADAAKEIGPRLRKGSVVICAPTGEKKK